jgi:hypothetical protein
VASTLGGPRRSAQPAVLVWAAGVALLRRARGVHVASTAFARDITDTALLLMGPSPVRMIPASGRFGVYRHIFTVSGP